MSSAFATLADKPSTPATYARCGVHRSALSLRPDRTVMEAYIAGDSYARAIVESWRFKFPIMTVTPERYAEMLGNTVVFVG